MHALIIEDEPIIAMHIEVVLGDCGFDSFAHARTPVGAFDAVAEHFPDLITSDVNLMPGNGIEIVSSICQARPAPVIFITGNVADVEEAMPGQASLKKPFSDENLCEAVAFAMTKKAVAVLSK